MPNHCANDLIITGDVDDVRAFAERVVRTGDDEPFSMLEELVPMPQFAADSDGWYSWAIENWGTKWSEYKRRVVNIGDSNLHLRFDTAWAPPLRGLTTISGMFPRLNFVLAYLEEGVGFAGVKHLRAGEYVAGFELEEGDLPICYAEDDDDLDDHMINMRDFHDRLINSARTFATTAPV